MLQTKLELFFTAFQTPGNLLGTIKGVNPTNILTLNQNDLEAVNSANKVIKHLLLYKTA